ncbi:MAG TPA: restriction endonuclease, partial [Oscillospiraceae bacterium]|nr:restriction endonuclease [Oscillospiraceae bacterium]
VFNTELQSDFSDWVSPRKPFGIESNIVKTEHYKATPEGLSSPVVCLGKGQQTGYIEKNLITSRIEWLSQWKVYIPRANNIGTELNDDNLNAFVGEPNTVCTEAYIVVGADKKLNSAAAGNLVVYLKTKFARFLHRQAKSSHDASRKTYRFIPIQDFAEDSKIDWSRSIEEIDNQLFDIYGLSDSERKHIQRSIKDM